MIIQATNDKQQTITRAKELADRLDKIDLESLDFIETILVYKLPHLSREEIKKMLSVYEVEIKQTRFIKKFLQKVAKKVGRQEECILLLCRLLRRKFGLQPQLENSIQALINLPLEKLEDLADALLDFNDITDLETWLADHR